MSNTLKDIHSSKYVHRYYNVGSNKLNSCAYSHYSVMDRDTNECLYRIEGDNFTDRNVLLLDIICARLNNDRLIYLELINNYINDWN